MFQMFGVQSLIDWAFVVCQCGQCGVSKSCLYTVCVCVYPFLLANWYFLYFTRMYFLDYNRVVAGLDNRISFCSTQQTQVKEQMTSERERMNDQLSNSKTLQ